MRQRLPIRSYCPTISPKFSWPDCYPGTYDGKSVLPYFNNRIAAEIRLPEAIDRKLLCPFQYFGVTDTVDLNNRYTYSRRLR